ncbi:MAG: hypothetical protein M3094_03825, partial [Actinomycetia bacterium]|nr:hypothetical protein [Actinomycetes bacterium]
RLKSDVPPADTTSMGHEPTTGLEEPPANLEFQRFGVDIDLLGPYDQKVGTPPNVLIKGNWTVRSS